MTAPNVVVQRAPDGWTHIDGPGMHLLIALDEDDERTLVGATTRTVATSTTSSTT